MKFEAFNSVELNSIKEVFNELSYLQLDVNLAYLVESYIYSIVKNDCLIYDSDSDIFKLEYRVRFDVKDGIYKVLYPKSGNTKVECSYKNDKKDGLYREWYPNGAKVECSYNNGLQNGLYREWYPNSENIKIEYSYKNGLRDGLYREWYRNGDKAIECTYKNDKKVGTFTSWFSTLDTGGQRNENDNTFTSCFYSEDNGKLVGKVINWYENGNIAIECSYSNDGKKDGDYKQYSEEGELHLHTIYKDGKIIEKIIQCDPEE